MEFCLHWPERSDHLAVSLRPVEIEGRLQKWSSLLDYPACLLGSHSRENYTTSNSLRNLCLEVESFRWPAEVGDLSEPTPLARHSFSELLPERPESLGLI